MISDKGVSERSLRPGMYGTLTAADAGSRGGLYQMSDRSTGVFNLPRYYPKYKSFRERSNDRSPRSGRSADSGNNPPMPFYSGSTSNAGNGSVDESVSSKPRNGKAHRQQPQPSTDYGADDRRNRRTDYNETFTVVDGFDAESLKKRRRRNRLISTVVIITILSMALIAVAIFLGIYLGGECFNQSI